MARELCNTRFFNDPNLVSYYRFEGNANASKGSVNGTGTNVTYGINYGKFGHGADFNGTSSRITFGTNFNFTTEDFSFSMWINFDSWDSSEPTQGGVFLYKGAWGETGYYIQVYKNGGQVIFVTCQSGAGQNSSSISSLSVGNWYHLVFARKGSSIRVYVNGLDDTSPGTHINPASSSENFELGSFRGWAYANCKIDDFAVFTRTLSPSDVSYLYKDQKSKYVNGIDAGLGILVKNNENSLGTDLVAWNKFKPLIDKSVNGGTIFSKEVVSTYNLIYTVDAAYYGGVLSSSTGDLHFIPACAAVGQKISSSGVVSTYSLVYTNGNYAYVGGVLATNGDIHFTPYLATRGQKISSSGVVSTYSLVYTVSTAYQGSSLDSNGDIHFIPHSAARGQKVSSSGVVSTYSLIYTNSGGAYVGGVLAPNGDLHFIPHTATVGQKISSSGVVSTYSLVYTATAAYYGGVLTPNGDIHFVPSHAAVGQKMSITGVVSTYSLIYTNSNYSNMGGVLAPNGDVYFVPTTSPVGQKVSITGVVSTYSLVYTTNYAYGGGILKQDGNIYLIPRSASIGQKISTFSAIPFPAAVCQSLFFNKF